MIEIRRAGDRGRTQTGWLDSRHTFSFADYHDARHMGFRALRVINDDRVSPAQGFGTHFHRDMEMRGDALVHALPPGRCAWLHVARGEVRSSGHDLSDGDGLSVAGETSIDVSCRGQEAEVILFDLADR